MRQVIVLAGMVLGLLIAPGTSHAAEKQFALRAGAMGAVYLVGETKDSVQLKLVFPAQQVSGYPEGFYGAGYKDTAPVTAGRGMVLFDDKGPLATLGKMPPLTLTFWCENDGGRQFRPEARLTLRKAQLRRPLRADPELQGLAGFVFHGSARDAPIREVSAPKGADIRMQGDLYGTGHTHALVWVTPDDARSIIRIAGAWINSKSSGSTDPRQTCKANSHCPQADRVGRG